MTREITEFQKRVYDALLRIPCGCVVTYAELARAVGCGSPRAVGQALRLNPYAPKVPCHRVISASRGIGGFNGEREGKAIAKKLRLLRSEGVVFKSGRLAEPNRLFRFPVAR